MNDDLISRDAVLKEISCWIGSGEYRYAMPERFLIDRLITLPSVTPHEPKTGHWILGICDNCGYDWGKDAPIASVPNYCPNCGCRMFEPQESDHKCYTCKHYTSGEYDGSCGSYICKGYSNWESEDKE